MRGTLALVGSGEFLEVMRPIDALLLDRLGGPAEARVVVIPTAAVPDGPQVVARWARMGRAHFGALGAQVEVAAIDSPAAAADAAVVAQIAAANMVYFSGGKPDFLIQTLRGSPAWEAALALYERGGVLAGCSAGAMILGGSLIAPRLRLGWPWSFEPGFGLVPGCVIFPHFDALPGPLLALARTGMPAELTLLGIDEETALVSDAEGWQVHGRAGVELRRSGLSRRLRAGERVAADQLPRG